MVCNIHTLRRASAFFLIFWIFANEKNQVLAQEPVVLATVMGMPLVSEGGEDGFLTLLANEVFSRIGLEVEIAKLPGERALINANAGIEDGELLRVEGMEKNYPNLIRVPESMMPFEFVGFSRPENVFPVMDWASLKPYVVGIVNGWKIYEKNVVDVKTRTDVRNIQLLFGLIENNRADVVLIDRWEGLYVSKGMGAAVATLEPPFAVRPMYMYLHKRRQDIVAKLATALAAVKKDGTYNRIYEQTLIPLTE